VVIRWVQTDYAFAPSSVSDSGGTASEEMHDEHHDTDYEQDVNDASGNVKGEEPEQPENDENCGYQCKHGFELLLL
jgi:hypothetical protein